MKYIQENLKEFEICGILKWHQRGYTGKGIKIAEIEGARPDLWIFDGKLKDPFGYGKDSPINNHGQKVLDVMHQVAPDAELYSLPSGIITSPNKVEGNFVEKTLPYAIENGIHIIGASLRGINNPLLNQKIKEAQNHGVVFVTSAGNEGERGLSGFAKSNVWIAVGALHYIEGLEKALLADYSSRGVELDIVSFSDLYVYDGRPGYEGRVFPQQGTSIAQPLVSGMLALVQQFFLEKAGRTLYQNEIELFIRDHVVDLGEAGFDEEYGHGLFVLPEPESIDIEKYLIRNLKETTPEEEEKPGMKKEIVLQIGNKTAYVNGQPVQLDVAPIMKDNRTLVPIRFVAEQMGCRVDWIADTKTIKITQA